MLVGHNGAIVLLPCTFLCNSAADNKSGNLGGRRMLNLYVKPSNECECKETIHFKPASTQVSIFPSYINTEDNNLSHLSAEANSMKTYPVWPFKSDVWGSPLEKQNREDFYAEVNSPVNAVLQLCPCTHSLGCSCFNDKKSVLPTWTWLELLPGKGGTEKEERCSCQVYFYTWK